MFRFQVCISGEGLAEIDGEPVVPDPAESVHDAVLDRLHEYAREHGVTVEAAVEDRAGGSVFLLQVSPDGSSELIAAEKTPGAPEGADPGDGVDVDAELAEGEGPDEEFFDEEAVGGGALGTVTGGGVGAGAGEYGTGRTGLGSGTAGAGTTTLAGPAADETAPYETALYEAVLYEAALYEAAPVTTAADVAAEAEAIADVAAEAETAADEAAEAETAADETAADVPTAVGAAADEAAADEAVAEAAATEAAAGSTPTVEAPATHTAPDTADAPDKRTAPAAPSALSAIATAVSRAAAAARAAAVEADPAAVPAELADRVGRINALAREGRYEEAFAGATVLRKSLTISAGIDHPHTVESRALEAYLAHLAGDHHEATVLALSVARGRCVAKDGRAPAEVARATAAWQWLEDDAAVVTHGHELLRMWEKLHIRSPLGANHEELAKLVRRDVNALTVQV